MTHPGPQGLTMETLLEQVQQQAGLSSHEQADRLVRATMSSLAERITNGQINDLSPALPPELRSELDRHDSQAHAFDKDTFLDRLSGEIDSVDLDEVEQQVRVVFGTLQKWLPANEVEDTLAQLPEELSALFR
ncbi:uncharacterized protein (DUF2267 family) [Saccharopolyspora lacisalsi]|uniref:Uncharacterized protein (DUF2267 family) n=1 Tax=Halosaccharopolyspora lacisalsi TaxID=1000566 RepID=A0A839DUH0_9PSEU|nr:DUF2267 domain-containing protein [Halosaccharopolyspora lacisalsi]MBA8824560.1 uncharacterized protein (DUF2267 family) [Halosaccharopolyspora lacisalsi]